MKDEKWFLIFEGEHLGPYRKDQLEELHHFGDINDSSKIWKDGWKDAKNYADVFSKPKADVSVTGPEDVDLPDLPPDLPEKLIVKEAKAETKVEAKVKTPQKVQKIETKRKVVKNPHTRKVKEIKEIVPTQEVSEKYEELDSIVEGELQIKKSKKPMIITMVLLLIAFIAFTGYELTKNPYFERPAGMGIQDFKRLMDSAKNENRDMNFEFALAKDKKTIWVATNSPLSGEVHIYLKSKETLGDKTELTAKGELKNHLLTINNFKFSEGVRIIDGYYASEIYTVKKLDVPLLDRLTKKRERSFRYLKDIFISGISEADYKKIKTKAKAKKEANDKRFWGDLRQEYLTVRNITEEIKVALDKVFVRKIKYRKARREEFENSYKTKYGVFFTSFVMSLDRKFDKISKTTFKDKVKVMSHYTKLKKLAKEIGAESVKVMENLRSVKITKLRKQGRLALKAKSAEPFLAIIKECDEMIAELDQLAK